MKKFYFSMLIAMMAVFGVKAQSWQYELSAADGLPGKNMGMYYQMTTPVYELDEATQTIRLTVFSTTNVDKNFSGFTNNSSQFPTFTIAELRLFDGDGNRVELTADMVTTNALSLNEGSIDAMFDNDPTTHFHSTYSKGEVPQAYHYIEIALTDAMSKFQLQWDTRYYYFFPDPTYVGITGGTEALPHKDYEFVLGEKVTSVDAIQPNKLYVIRGNYFEFTRTEDERTLPSYGEAFYNQPGGAALTPSAASLLWLEDAGNGKYFMHWLGFDRYLKAGGEVEAGAYAEATTDPTQAAALEFAECDSVEGAFIITSENNYLGQRRFVRMSWVNKDNMAGETSTYNYAWNLYEASTNMLAMVPFLQEAIDKAEELMAIQGIASEDDGEYEALKTAVAAAKELIAADEEDGDATLAAYANLVELINAYRITYIYVLSDSIAEILENEEIVFCEDGWVEGGYPASWEQTLTDIMDEAGQVADAPTSSALVENTISKVCNTLTTFYASAVKGVANFPIHLDDEKDGLTTEDKRVGNRFNFTSPVYYLSEATDVIRFTWFRNTSMELKENCGNVVFISLAEIYLYDELGNKIELREDMISTNSVQPNDGDGIAALCDGNEGNYYHGCWNPDADGAYCPQNGEYAYIDIALDTEISAFSYKFIGRDNSNDFYKHYPIEYAITPGTLIDYDEIKVTPVDEFKGVRGEQITDASQIQAGELYVLWGNLQAVSDGTGGSGYYDGAWQNRGKDMNSASVITFEDAGDGKFYMRNLSSNAYLKTPAGWEGATATYFTEDAVPLSIMASSNLENSFKIYYEGTITDPTEDGYGNESIFVMQAWQTNIGMFTITDWDSDDTDGESDWYIYKASVENKEKLNLTALISAVESFGIDYENVGDAVGMLDESVVAPIATAVAKAQAVVETGDDAACKAAAAELAPVIQTIPSIKTNPLISGEDYVIRSANKEFKDYHTQNIAMFVGPKNGSGADANAANMVYFNYEYSIDGMDSTVFHWTFTHDTIVNEGEETWAKYTIKNVLYDEYIVPAFPNGKNLTTSPFSSNDAAPLIYMRPSTQKVGQWVFVGVDAWAQPSYPNYCYFETRTGGGPYGTSGAAHYGRVATWSYSANTAQWKVIPVSKTTSISDIVVDEPAGEVISTTYITPDGVTSNVPAKGVCIIRKVYANGVVKTEKKFIK